MKKILGILNMVAVLTILVALGLVGYLVGTGRLDKEKSQTMLDLVRHPGTPADLRQQVATVLEPKPAVAATVPASTKPASPGSGDAQAVASAAERIEYTRQAMEQEQLRLEHEAQELQHRQELLDQKRAQIDARLAELDAQKKTFQTQVAATQAAGKSAAFAKSLELYDELKPKQVKDIFIGLSPDAAADFIKAMDPSRAGKIIAEFKAPEEKAFLASVLEKIRSGDLPLGTTSASTVPTTAPADASQAKTP